MVMEEAAENAIEHEPAEEGSVEQHGTSGRRGDAVRRYVPLESLAMLHQADHRL
jgi:hypothetical protein